MFENFLLETKLSARISDNIDGSVLEKIALKGQLEVIKIYEAKLKEFPESQIIQILSNLLKIPTFQSDPEKFKSAFLLQKEFSKIDFTNSNMED